MLGPKAWTAILSLSDQARLPHNIRRIVRNRLATNRRFAGIAKGRTCFVLATGPSVAKQDISLLSTQSVVSINEMFDYLPRRGIVPEYIIIHDRAYFNREPEKNAFIEDLSDASSRFGFQVVSTIEGARLIEAKGIFPNERLTYMAQTRTGLLDFRDAGIEPKLDFHCALPGLYTATHTAVAWAIFLGFDEINIMGVDLDFDRADAEPLKRCYGDSPYNRHHTMSASEAFRRDLGWTMDHVRKHAAMQIEAFEYLYQLAARRGQKIFDATLYERLGAIPKRHFEKAIHARPNQ